MNKKKVTTIIVLYLIGFVFMFICESIGILIVLLLGVYYGGQLGIYFREKRKKKRKNKK